MSPQRRCGRNMRLIGLLIALVPLAALATGTPQSSLPQSGDQTAAIPGGDARGINTAESDEQTTNAQKPRAGKPPAFVYQPPKRGAPKARIGGGTRSIRPLLALAPKHLALTSNSQPRLYWYIAPGFNNELRFRLHPVGITMAPPLLEIVLPPQPNGGIYHMDLAQHGVRLQSDLVYEWGILLEPQPHQRWRKIFSGGSMQLVEPLPAVDAATPDLRPYLAAEKGLWYDALEGVSRLLEREPGDLRFWRLQRADLLKQGKLMEAAAYEREMAGQ